MSPASELSREYWNNIGDGPFDIRGAGIFLKKIVSKQERKKMKCLKMRLKIKSLFFIQFFEALFPGLGALKVCK